VLHVRVFVDSQGEQVLLIQSTSRLMRYRLLGLAGSVVTASGGVLAGVLPARDPLAHLPGVRELRGSITCAVLVVYLGTTMLLVAWWRVGGLLRQTDRPGRRDIIVTAAWWAAPFALITPIFSGDVYSYLAQGAMTAIGINPYKVGPAMLGGHLAANVPAIWQHTPTPYGPVFLRLASGITQITGSATWLGILGMRAVAVAGLAMLVWSAPCLARAGGVDPVAAVWLGVLNPLVLMHLVGDAHNDTLMLGLMAVGLVLALRSRPGLGVVVLTLAALIKAPAALAIAFVVPIWAGQHAGRGRWVRVTLAVTAIAVATASGVTALAGTGYGWVAALGTPTRARTWMSVTTDLGSVFGLLARWSGVATIEQARHAVWLAGVCVAGCLCVLLWRRSRELGPVVALGLCLASFVVLGPVVHPWYLLWGIVPLAVAAGSVAIRRAVTVASVALILLVLPGGVPPGLPALAGAALGTTLVLVVVGLFTDLDGHQLWAPLAAPSRGSHATAGPGPASRTPIAQRILSRRREI